MVNLRKNIKKLKDGDVFSLKELKIGGHKYKILFVDDLEDCGEFNNSTGTIKIKAGMPKSQTEETLLHEIIHACNPDLKEEVVGSLSMILYQVYRDNL